MSIYYDGKKLRNMKDLNNEKPEIYITAGNRTAGKSYDWKKFLISNFLENGIKFMLLYRWNYEIAGCENAFYQDLSEIDFPGHEIDSYSEARGLYKVITLDGEEMAYAVYLNGTDALKRVSSRFTDVDWILFDEFQSETEHYCDKEIDKFQSLHTSVARGKGKQSRYVPVALVSNNVSILNPYFVALGIHKRLDSKTKFMRGDGWVMEITRNEHAIDAAKNSAFNKAFKNSAYYNYATNNFYLLDSDTFVEKRNTGNMMYQATIIHSGKYYGIWNDHQGGVYYCSSKGDPSCHFKFAILNDDHSENTRILDSKQGILQQWRIYYNIGKWRFENLECKNVLIDLLARR